MAVGSDFGERLMGHFRQVGHKVRAKSHHTTRLPRPSGRETHENTFLPAPFTTEIISTLETRRRLDRSEPVHGPAKQPSNRGLPPANVLIDKDPVGGPGVHRRPKGFDTSRDRDRKSFERVNPEPDGILFRKGTFFRVFRRLWFVAHRIFTPRDTLVVLLTLFFHHPVTAY